MVTPFRLIWFTSFGARHWDALDYTHYDWRRPEIYRDMARLLEKRGGFDAIVFADGPSVATIDGDFGPFVKYGLDGVYNDPVPLLAALSWHTERIGLVGTLSTSTYPPFLLARLFATLDHMSSGRAGWNLVTSEGGPNFGAASHMSKQERYDRADEYLDLVERLWDSWEPGAVLLDRASGRFADPSKVHETNFEGRYFRSRGPMTLPRSPQGHPVIMQAGGSDRGRQFAARHAEIIISHRNSPEAMKDFREDLRARMRTMGRDPDTCKIFFTVRPFIGDTLAEAKAMRTNALSSPTINLEVGLAALSARTGRDYRNDPLDEPLRTEAVDEAASAGILEQHTERGETLREAAMSEAMKETFVVEGDPRQVAERFAEVMDYVGGDGLAIRETMMPSTVLPITDRVAPVLREMGLVRNRYAHKTFRENLLDPAFAAASRTVAAGGMR
jgi:FMN-dependent oxidoreductase (nitrilotriacetate monooxygenase family)